MTTYKTIGELVETATKNNDDFLEVFQDGKSYKIKLSELVKKDSYDLAVGTSAQLNVDNGVFNINNTTAGAKSVVMPTGLSITRAQTFVVVVRGNAGTVTWDAGIHWDGGVAPSLAANVTIAILLWDGQSMHGTHGAKY